MLEIPCWSIFETALESDGDCLNPLTDTPIVLELESPSGRQLRVHAFWDGGRTWRARFSPDEAGEWRWAWSGAGRSHSARRGAFHCVPYHGDNPLYLHGAVRRSADRRHLAHADGTPFFWLADTAWNGVLRARGTDWTRYLQTRRAQGFSAIQFVLTQWRGCRLDPLGETAFSVEADRLRINPAFFQRMDPKVAMVNANGLVAAPVLLWALIDSDPGLALPEELAVRLARYLVARYGAYQVVWFLAGDGDYRLERAERWKRIGSAVFADRHDRLVTMHPTGMHWVAGEFRNEPWYDFIGYQSGHGDSDPGAPGRWHVLGPPANDWATEPVLPVINLEPNYEAHISYDSANRFTDLEVRRATWWSCLNAPTAGVSYGHHAIWPWAEQPGPVDGHPSVGPAPTCRGPRPWKRRVCEA